MSPGSPAGKARPGVLAGPQNADAPFGPTLRAVQDPWTGLSGRASRARVVLLDPDPDLPQSLITAGFEVIIPDSSRDLLPQLRRAPPDAVVLDTMSRADGWALLQQIRGEPWIQSPTIILVSGPDDRVRGLQAGAADFLTRPFDVDELTTRLEKRLAEKTEVRPHIEGDLHVHSVAELLQTLETSTKSGELRVTNGGLSGSLLLRQGKVVTAQSGGYRGSTAVRVLLEWTTGRFHFQPSEIVGGHGGDLDLAPLLMDQAWVEDELWARGQHMPPLAAMLEISGALGDIPEKMVALPIQEVFEYLAGSSSVAWSALHGRCLDSPRRVELAVAWLCEQGIARGTALGATVPSRERPHLLIVDPASTTRDNLSELVTRAGWAPTLLRDGAEALEEIWHLSPTPSLILVDAELGEMDGYKFTSKLRETASFNGVPIVMLTAKVGEKYRQRAIAAGVTEYLVKPYRDEILLQLIRRLT